MTIDVTAKALMALAGGLAALALAAPAAADPADVPPPPAVPPVAQPVVPAAQPAAAPVIAAAGQAPVTAAAGQAPVDGVPHLPSPDAPPPGSTMDPSVMAGAESPRVSYLRDLWHAVQSQEISGKEALVLGLAQRGMDTPNPASVPAPNTPLTPGDPAPAPGPALP